MYESGVDISVAIDTMSRTAPHPALRHALGNVSVRIRRGEKLSEAMRTHPRVFPALATGMVEVGEESGKLDRTTRELARYYKWTDSLKKATIAGLIYPAVMLTAALFVITGFLYLMPRLSPEAAPFGESAAGIFAFTVVCIAVGLFVAAKLGRHCLPGRYAFHAFLAKAPFIARLYRKIALGRFSFVLHLTVASGLDIMDCVRRSGAATNNLVYGKACDGIARKLLKGDTLAEAMAASRVFPPEYVAVIQTGEHTGKLDEVALKLAERYREESELAIKILITVGSFLIWAAVAAFLIAMIMWMFFRFYLGHINEAMSM